VQYYEEFFWKLNLPLVFRVVLSFVPVVDVESFGFAVVVGFAAII
jgi:hypothetical protein